MRRRLIKIMSVSSLAIVLAMGGGATYLWATGGVDAAKLDQIVSIVKGTAASAEPAPVVPTAEASPEHAEQAIGRVHENDEIAWRNHLRRLAEIDQRKTTVQLEMLRVEKAREAYTREKELASQEQRARQKLDSLQGFKKELELVAQMKPKQALDYVLAKGPEDAAYLLLKLDERSAKRIVQAAKSEAEKTKLNQVLELMKDITPPEDEAKAGKLTESAPTPSTPAAHP